MSRSRSSLLWWILTAIALSVGLIILGNILVIRSSFPTQAGTLSVPGLDEPVDIYRDARGVPHIYASTEHDLFMAQGYVHAQDRFWQMDFNRHIGSGELSEMFGSGRVDTDRFLKTLGWERIAQQEMELLDPGVIQILQAYADGVNAYLDSRSGSALSYEYLFLQLLAPDYQVEPWDPVDTLVWAKVMAWDLSGNMDSEISRSVMLSTLTPQQMADLYPEYPEDHPVIVTDTGAGAVSACTYQDPLMASAQARSALAGAAQQISDAQAVLGESLPDLGSNSWVVTGSLTPSGSAYLANDTHLGIQLPSIWYANGLHCRADSPDCRFNVAGFSFPGAPAVILGHNDHIAWGLTNLGPDVQDLYIERINPDNPDQYERDGAWVDMQIVEDEIRVAGGDPVPLRIRSTVHGPLIGPTYGPLEDYAVSSGLQTPQDMAVALRWTALEPSSIFEAVINLNMASNWDEFRTALQDFDVPSQNFVYADRDGNIGYQSPGRIPIRGQGQGCLPSPGWDSSYDWQGFIPFEELPSRYNPPEEYIVTANNAVVGEQYGFDLSPGWDYGFRAERIVAMIEGFDVIGPDEIGLMHGDNFNAAGQAVVPTMLQVLEDQLREAGVYELLSDWDYQDHMDSTASAVFNAFWRNLLRQTFGDELQDGPIPGSSRAFLLIERIQADPHNEWWDDVSSEPRESMPSIFARAWDDALKDLNSELGRDVSNWRWGDMHTATFRNQSLGVSGIAPLEALFNRGPFPASGGSSIVNATGWSIENGYQVGSLPSQRLIVDLGDLNRSLAIHTTGQSGHAFHRNYIDMADPWRLIQYDRLPWEVGTIMELSASHLRLEP